MLDTLLDPGSATDFFTLTRGAAFRAEAESFDPVNALWLAELSRLIYRRSGDEHHPHPAPSRIDFLAKVGMEELKFFDDDTTEGALIQASGFRILVFRGTEPKRFLEDLTVDIKARLGTKAPFPGLVHEGFADAIHPLSTSILGHLTDSAGTPLFITGHSLGGALAVLATFLCQQAAIPVAATYTYGCPRVGDDVFCSSFAHGDHIFRFVNDKDPVPRVPPFLLTRYRHAGVLEQIENDGELQHGTTNQDGPGAILPPWQNLLDHIPVHYVEKLQKIVAASA